LWRRGAQWLSLCLIAASVASCSTTTPGPTKPQKRHGKEYFSEKEYGVKASPRLYTGRKVPKGGGRDMIGKPYKVKGKWYAPKEDKKYDKVGLASWYGSAFHGRLTANGEIYDQFHLSAAHPTFPLPSYARVTNLTTGDSLIVRVNDRGPYHPGRIIDLSDKAAEMLDVQHHGTAKVRVQYVGRARMDGHDMPYLMASYARKGERLRRFNHEGEIASGVLVASNTPKFRAAEPIDDVVTERPSTATALVATAVAVDSPALVEFEQFVQLPEFGPYPAERPSAYKTIDGTLSAYADMRVRDANGPFDAILRPSGDLDAEAIRQSALRMSPGLY
jgi:rare lipoprotein A